MSRSIAVATGLAISLLACVEGQSEGQSDTEEIISNLQMAGFPADDIMVVGETVYVGRDAEVSLLASREMLETGDSTKEQYETNNFVALYTKICINGSTFTGPFSTALDRAIENYDERPLLLYMARMPSTFCTATIDAVIEPGLVGGHAGFPSSLNPFPTIFIGGGLSTFSIDTIEHVITHELGHTIGFRHSDFFNRSISCGMGGNEGDGGVGAIHIPGTPTGATVGGSLMNSCFRTSESGELTGSDATALLTLYGGAVPALQPHANSDFDGDGEADPAVFRPSNGTWFVLGSNGGQLTLPLGNASDIPVAGDYDGDGKTDIALWRENNTTWFGRHTSDGTVFSQSWGITGDIPVPGDYDGDRRTDLAVWRPSNATWFIRRSSDGGQVIQPWGIVGDIPVVGDFDGDGRADFAVWRPSNTTWFVMQSSSGALTSQSWGISGDIPVPGDYDGDRKTDFAVWRPSNASWFVIRSSDGAFVSQQWGVLGDIPVTDDFDGDRKTDFGVWRPSNTTWFVRLSLGTQRAQSWGIVGDVPVSRPVGL